MLIIHLFNNIWKTYKKNGIISYVGQGCENGARCHNFGQKKK